MLSTFLRVASAALVLTALQIGGGILLDVLGVATPQPPSNPLPWLLADNLLIVVVLSWLAFRSTARGWRLAGLLVLLLFGIATFNSLIEAQFFGFFGTAYLLALMAVTLGEVALFAPVAVLLLRSPLRRIVLDEGPPRWQARLSFSRLLTGGIVYLVMYFAAGSIVFPFVRDFYATKPMPHPLTLFAFQALLRGPIFVALLYAAVRTMRAARADAVIVCGALLSIIGGVGLMIPNGFFPDYVRWSHFFEVTISNFAYGAFVGWLLTRPVKGAESHHAAGGHLAEIAR